MNEDFLLQVKKYGVLGFRIMSYYTEIIYVILKEKWCFVFIKKKKKSGALYKTLPQ